MRVASGRPVGKLNLSALPLPEWRARARMGCDAGKVQAPLPLQYVKQRSAYYCHDYCVVLCMLMRPLL